MQLHLPGAPSVALAQRRGLRLRRPAPVVAVESDATHVVRRKCEAAPQARQVQTAEQPGDSHRTVGTPAITEIAIHRLAHMDSRQQIASDGNGRLERHLIQRCDRRSQRHLRWRRFLPEGRSWSGCGRRLSGVLLTPSGCAQQYQQHDPDLNFPLNDPSLHHAMAPLRCRRV